MSNWRRVDRADPNGFGALIDWSRPVRFRVDGDTYVGYAGDSLASALLANDRHFVARSFKYHRPRGLVAAGVEEPNALFGVGTGDRFEPNQRGTMVELHDGLVAKTQNNFPTLERDVGSVNALMARMFPAGFYYKTFIKPRAAWKHVFEPIIRRAAGLGKAPRLPDPDRYEQIHLAVDVLVAGGGVAGVMAAKAAAATGARVLLAEQAPHLGGRALVDGAARDGRGDRVDGAPAADWIHHEIAALRTLPNVVVRTRCQVSALEDHGYALLYERVADHWTKAERKAAPHAPRHRLWRVRAGRVVMAAGAVERPIAFAQNDVPGVMLASAVRDYLGLYGVKTGERVVVFTTNDDAYRTALDLRAAGAETPLILDAREGSNGDLPQRARAEGVEIRFGAVIAQAIGGKRVAGVDVMDRAQAGAGDGTLARIDCDCVAMSGGWSPAAHLWSQPGGSVAWDAENNQFAPDAGRPPTGRDGAPMVLPVGAASGALSLSAAIEGGLAAGAAAAEAVFGGDGAAADIPRPPVDAPREDAPSTLWFAPSVGKTASGSKHFVDFQNDVTAADIRLAAREGYESVEHAKRYTTLGMATDQGKLSNVIGAALLAEARGIDISEVGTTKFRPPYTPISFGSIAGQAAKDLFKPVRRTAIYAWHGEQGAVSEPVGDWRRPFAYPIAFRNGGREDIQSAVIREIVTTREGVGILDASTLGKILVTGPDAGVFLDRLYTNMISTLKPGRCRYALMCDDGGFLFDDGVVARLADGPGGQPSFLCHTTSGGADRVHGWMEEWLQTEWPDLRVYTANMTEQYAQIAVAGPRSRELLEALSPEGLDLSSEGLPFMAYAEGVLAGCPARVHRISFSGELSFEIATPSAYGLSLWGALLEAGRPMDVTPYGTEALHIMRAEKGFIMIGDETDGTVTPRDLNLDWAISKKKRDFIGKAGMERPFLTDPSRRRLVGLLTEDPKEVLPHGCYAVATVMRSQTMRTIGHVTSSYWSPTLGRSIAMALVERGPERMGEYLSFPIDDKKVIRAQIVSPVFYDPQNARRDGAPTPEPKRRKRLVGGRS